jgi:hypothetical protein
VVCGDYINILSSRYQLAFLKYLNEYSWICFLAGKPNLPFKIYHREIVNYILCYAEKFLAIALKEMSK